MRQHPTRPYTGRASDDENPAALVEHQTEWTRRAALLLSEVRGLQLRISPLPGEANLCSRLDQLGFVRARGSRPDSPGVDRDIPRGSARADPAVWEKLLFWHEEEQAILHVRRADSPWGLYTIWFRDWLRASPEARHRYEIEKRRLSADQRGKKDYDDYTRAKTEFFDEVQSEFEEWASNRG